ncbi:aminotransferase class III-fold pyridoxal phosphate-dependent enzyme [Mycobacterium sp. 21AC1]|uniref:aminotransferase class III-fold pyridoxal phosphate-dependent enzyme n=1 Tax=[Mycobacterium] appelbergii TaxID=2939269 RepID=UPI002938FC66|nr:aminotransferase class III-fold pyridoxal phosphate-dependent enzyme [Mycobacterium sp. 21AC1]MDV3127282.1 aminotransferase class III-fold pyridoxal phosphate-dependent enzyme [Mycobacterium sp. 21AC1]
MSADSAIDSRRAEPIDLDEAIMLVQSRFGLSVTDPVTLGGEFDQNLRVTDARGSHYLVKISAVFDSDTTTAAWHEGILRHLAATAPELPLPRLHTATDGAQHVIVTTSRGDRMIRLLTWLTGAPLAEQEQHSDELLTELGHVAGKVSNALSTMPEPDVAITHDWDMRRARSVVDSSLDAVGDADRRADITEVMSWFDTVEPLLAGLPRGVAHQDLNDSNILVDHDGDGRHAISGVLDLGDALYTVRVAELAVATAYALVRKDDPMRVAQLVVAGFDSVAPLTDDELAVVFPLAAARLAMNAATWTQRNGQSHNAHGEKRMRHTWPALSKVAGIDPDYAEAALRHACGRPAHPDAERVVTVLDRVKPAPWSPRQRRAHTMDTSTASDLFDGIDWTDPREMARSVDAELGTREQRFGVIGHLQPNLQWAAQRGVGSAEPRTTTLGVRLLITAGETIRTPIDGVVVTCGQQVTVRHDVADEAGPLSFFTHWSGLSGAEVGPLAAGHGIGTAAQDSKDGFGTVVGMSISLPRRHHRDTPWPARVRPGSAAVLAELSPDPSPILGLDRRDRPGRLKVDQVLAIRQHRLASSQRAYYRAPMNLQRGRDVWLYDEDGLAYLDSLNNVTHVGHAEPRIALASSRQMNKLNTNSRFIYEDIATYADKLVATLPDPLEVVFLVCSGSEANDLAIRIARQVTGRPDIAIVDGAYHGNTGVVTGLSPNRYKGPGGAGAPATTHETPIPDRYRGPYGYDDPLAGAKYGARAAAVIDAMAADGTPPAAFLAESLMGSAGNIVFGEGYLATAFAAARKAGALCISDEVQVGVGRMGDTFWGFELGGVVPDIVTMGKPLGNGHPLAAVVTTREIADAFDTGMKYFNTFGGNPVSCAIGSTVLDIIISDGLQHHAKEVGAYFADSLRQVQRRQPLIGDIRAQGLYLGVELVRDRDTKEPAKDEAFEVTELMKEEGVIVFPNGVYDNVLKIKPPMSFQTRHADIYCEALDRVLTRLR